MSITAALKAFQNQQYEVAFAFCKHELEQHDISANTNTVLLTIAAQCSIYLKKFEAAEFYSRQEILLRPENLDCRAVLVESLIQQTKLIQAKNELEFLALIERESKGQSDLAPWLARKYFEIGDNAQALEWCEISLKQESTNPLLYNLQGCISLASQDTKKALEAFASELRLEPDNARTHLNLSVALRQARSHERALHHLERAKNIDPENFTDLTGLYYVSSILMDLNRKEAYGEELLNNYSNKQQAKDPFTFFMLTDDIEKIRIANENYSKNYQIQDKKFTPIIFPKTHLKIGYASCDFKDHATAFLMRDLLSAHDRSNVEIIGLDFSAQKGSGFQKEFQSRFDERIDITAFTDSESARLIREMEIDVLIDLKGYTEGARPGIFFRRPCRVQVNYLGYPGTMGSLAHDFIIGDSVITPEHLDHGYTEAVVELSCCYQPNDPDRIIGSESLRESHSLPKDTFIFCSFNYHKKLNKPILESWARILNQCPNSILWVLGTDNDPKFLENLESCGIPASRVLVAPKLAMPNHVERIRHASVFLDSFPCGAHTTASDALFSGVPVITIQGQAFHSRVASSIMTFAGAPECVASSIYEYEQIAQHLYENPAILHQIKTKLLDKTQPLSPYNTSTLATQLEKAFRQMVEQESPSRIKV
jgi:protein O-GlcNAc transferase